MNMKKILLFFTLAFTAMTGTAADFRNRPSRDFIHEPCVFDTLLATFRRVAACYGSPGAVTGSAWADDIGFSRYRWEVPSLSNRKSVSGSLPYYPDKVLTPAERSARDSVVANFVRTVEALHRRADWSVETEKARLVSQMEAFGDTATVLPWVYAVIAQKYKGSVQAYVDALFKRSAMTNVRRLRRFAKSPVPSRMLDDMGIQFVVSRLMFRQWETQRQPAADGARLVILRSELEKR